LTRLPGQMAVTLAALLWLAACDPVDHTAPNRASTEVAGQVVDIVLPEAYCFDKRSSDRNSHGAFFIAITCDAAPGGDNAAITILVANQPLTGDLDALETFLKSDGAPILGRSGEPDKVSVLSTRQREGALYLKVRDRGRPPFPGASETFWQAFFEAGNRMVRVTVSGFAGSQLSDQDAVNLLSAIASQTVSANTSGAA
jgi:hypothetical protein